MSLCKLKFVTDKKIILFPEGIKASQVNLEIDNTLEIERGRPRVSELTDPYPEESRWFSIQTIIIPPNSEVYLSRPPSGTTFELLIKGNGSKIHFFTYNDTTENPSKSDLSQFEFTALETLNLSFVHPEFDFAVNLIENMPFKKIWLGKLSDATEKLESFQVQPGTINCSLYSNTKPWRIIDKYSVVFLHSDKDSKITYLQIPPYTHKSSSYFKLGLQKSSGKFHYIDNQNKKHEINTSFLQYVIKKFYSLNFLLTLSATMTILTAIIKASNFLLEYLLKYLDKKIPA